MAQDILSLGINIESFDEQKRAVLNDYISLFNQLSKYDGKVFNPIVGGGLNDLNTSVKETSLLLDQLNAKISSIGKSKTSGAKDSFTEQALAVKEYAKQTDAASVASAKLSVLTSDQAKQTAALKLQLSDTTKEILVNARAESEAGKAKSLASIQAKEYSIEQQRVVSSLRQLAIEQDREAAIQAKASKDKEAAMLSESNAVRNLASDYTILKNTLASQKDVYASSLVKNGADHPDTKLALSEYAATAGIVGNVNEKLNTSHGILSVIGKDLSTYYNRLRIIAYILPGIGVAGIFSLAFEAISKATENLGLFDDRIEKYTENEIEVNKILKEQLDLYEKIHKSYTELRGVQDQGRTNFDDELSLEQKQGYDQITMLNNKKVKAESDIIQSGADILKNTGNSPETLKFDLDRRLAIQKDYVSQINEISTKIANAQNPPVNRTPQRDINGKLLEVQGTGDISKSNIKILEDQKKDLQAKLSNEQDYYSKSYSLLTKYQSQQKDLFDLSAELDKARNDDKLKRDYELAQNRISLSKEMNDKILKSELSTEKEKLAAISQINRLTKESDLNDLNKVLTNISSTQGEKDIAISKNATANRISDIKTQIQTNQELESYRQKRLTAQEEIDKSTISEVVNTNEKVYQNEQKSIYERLTAYSSYIVNKQKIDDIEYRRNIDVLSLKTGDPTAQLQIQALNKHREEQKLSDQAGVEKEVYNIVYGSEHKQLDLIKEVNQGRYEDTKSQHAKEITELTDSLNRKQISYRKYYKEIEKLQKDLTSKDLKSDINVDKENIFDLEEKGSSLAKQGVDAKSAVQDAKDHLGYAKQEGLDTLPYQKEYDIAVGNEQAISKAIIDIDTATSVAKRKLGDDELRLALLNIEKRKHAEDELNKVITEIGNKVLDGSKQLVDAGYQYQESVVEKKKELIDEGLQSELNAISVSTLSNKDKAALDIQLNEQKKENDKNADLEERRLKRSQAEADRAFTVAKIVWNTEQAISKTYAEFGSLPIAFPLAIAQGVLGAVEIATVLATPIPAFKEGVKGFKGGFARTGEDGVEEIREPYKSPYLVYKDTVSYLPAGTDVIPLEEMDIPEQKVDTGWDQTRWLAKQMKKNNREIKNVFRPVINIDLGFENHKRKILGI